MAILKHRLLSRVVRLLSVAAFMLLCIQAQAEEQPLQLDEQKIKAGLIYNFIKYTDWPSSGTEGESAPIIICIFGQDPFNGYLQPIEDRTVKQRNITVHRVDDVAKTAGCNLLVIGGEEKQQWPQIHEFLADKNVLTVSDITGFSESGGMIQFSKNNNHISLYLNTKAIAAAHLHIQDNLIKISSTMSAPPRGDR